MTLKILVVGLGSMGKRRIRNLVKLGYRDILGFDTQKLRRNESSRKYKIKTVKNILSDWLPFTIPRQNIVSMPKNIIGNPKNHFENAKNELIEPLNTISLTKLQIVLWTPTFTIFILG